MKNFRSFFRTGVIITLATLAGSAYSADEFEYHGYFRTGIGASEGGTDQVCYQLPRAGGNFFRLGNECGTYGELEFTKIFGDKNGTKPWFQASVLNAFTSNTDQSYEEVGTNSSMFLANIYIEGNGLLPGDAKVWVGKRFYQRRGIHMLDLFYISSAGPGAGVYDLDVGPGKFDLALFRSQQTNGPTQSTLDLRYDMKAAGDLEVVAMTTATGKRNGSTGDHEFEALSGNSLTLTHKMKSGGFSNTFAAQYGTGLLGAHKATPEGTSLNNYNNGNTVAKDNTVDRDAIQDSSSMRIIDEVMLEGKDYAASFVALYTSSDFGGAVDSLGSKVKTRTVTSFGVRPYYFLTDTQALAIEVGTTTYSNPWLADSATGSDKSWTLNHTTFAYNLRMSKGYYARPEFKFYVTRASWNDDASGVAASQNYSGTDGFSIGAQAEVWW